MRARTRLVGLVAFGLLCPGVAQAATVSVTTATDPTGYTRPVVSFVALPGERNALTATAEFDTSATGMSWDFADAGAGIAAGPGCASVDPHHARCEAAPLSASVDLGDGDDQLAFAQTGAGFYFVDLTADGGGGDDTLTGPGVQIETLRGGAGDDQLSGGDSVVGDTNVLDGGPGDDLLVGGSGSDWLDGGGGADRLDARAGRDRLTDGDRDGATPGPDVLDGGPGRDEVSYELRRRGVSVNLITGASSDGDRLSGIESVVGGRGDDRLVGDGHGNVLDGLGGHDVLFGGGGNDRLRPGGDRLSCGPGRDVVSRYNRGFFPVARPDDPELGARDFLGADCERVGYEFEDSLGTLPAHPRLTKRGDPYFRLSCPATEDGLLPCKEIVTLRRDAPHHTLVARGATPTGPWRDHRVTAHLTTRGRRLATRPRGVRTTVRIVLQAQRSYRLGWTIRLRVPHVPRSHP